MKCDPVDMLLQPELDRCMKVISEALWLSTTTVECEKMEETEEDWLSLELISLFINFLNLFLLLSKISLVPVKIISGISQLIRIGDSNNSN